MQSKADFRTTTNQHERGPTPLLNASLGLNDSASNDNLKKTTSRVDWPPHFELGSLQPLAAHRDQEAAEVATILSAAQISQLDGTWSWCYSTNSHDP